MRKAFARGRSGAGGPARSGPLPLPVVLPALLTALPVTMTFAVIIGSVEISFVDTWRILAHRVFPDLVEPAWPRAHEAIVLTARLPRVLLAAVVGAGLALVGVVLQTLVRNPLADPLLLGVSSGATFGAVLVVISGFTAFGLYSLPVSAFLGALASLIAVYLLAQTGGRTTTTRLILSGVVVGQVMLSAANLIIMTSGDPHAAKQVTRWTLGGLGGTGWDMLPLPSVVLLAVLVLLVLQMGSLNVLMLGEETATGMGLPVHRFRAVMFVLASLATGVMVAVSGAIGFVGLMMPHIARLLVGTDHRRVLPVAPLLGAVFLVVADLAARTLASPEEIPVGILTALCGAPFFLWLMRRDAGNRKPLM
ncbi:FecCD family ABC transporter permease [Allosalinactinospora lopnorensis]|uniref:FecCD family ABC transporter permease n=1 Tax=Allosalinactinospora lopnorensis TaxID=1352348 RepID=UPI00373FC68B